MTANRLGASAKNLLAESDFIDNRVSNLAYLVIVFFPVYAAIAPGPSTQFTARKSRS
jgi:hypothetical protein